MKKIICLFLSVFICLSFCSCASSEKTKEIELTEEDYKYIDSVYSVMSQWDTTHYDSGKDHYINKIAFFDFDGNNTLSFYKNYPVGGYCGSGYYVYSDRLEKINPDVYDYDTKTIHTGCLMQTVLKGTEWDYTATDKEKYEIIKSAYIDYLDGHRGDADIYNNDNNVTVIC